MSRSNIRLGKLCCRGQGLPDASIKFEPGLNVITGPSNTGKSYIFQCIDFMLGGGKAPKSINESAGYQQVLLEVVAGGSTWTLVRGITGGAAQLYETSLDQLSDKSIVVKTLSEKNGAKAGSISGFFLEKMGIPSSVKVKVDRNNVTRALSLRHIAHLFCVNETSIQIEGSPVLVGVVNDETVLESAFRYLLTGQDDKGLVPSPKTEVTTTRIKAKEEVYGELIDIAQAELTAIELQIDSLPDATVLSTDIARVTSLVEDFAGKMEALAQIKASKLENLAELESKAIALNELTLRFKLLHEHYQSDLKRLDFIAEGAHLMDQLQVTNCPTCGQAMHQTLDAMQQDAELDKNIEIACEGESRKIRLLLSDLDSTFENLTVERSALEADCLSLRNEIAVIDRELSGELTPQLNLEKSRLRTLFEMQEIFTRKVISKDKVASLRVSLAGVKKKERDEAATVVTREPVDTVKASTYREGLLALCKNMEDVLQLWGYKDSSRVEFDSESLDFIIDGTPRQSNGKGRRAFLHAAFNLAFLYYCQNRERGYPNFLVLDSPLTTLKEGKATVLDEVPISMQESFFRNLVLNKEVQSIILENKEPPLDVSRNCNLIQFTQNNTGRYGFFSPR